MVDREWLNPDFFLPKIAPELVKKYRKNPTTYGEIIKMKGYAYNMVRYAISPNPRDSMSIDPMSGEWLVNPQTSNPFTLEELGIDRSQCIGTTVSAARRYPMVAQVTVALYRAMHPEAQAKRT